MAFYTGDKPTSEDGPEDGSLSGQMGKSLVSKYTFVEQPHQYTIQELFHKVETNINQQETEYSIQRLEALVNKFIREHLLVKRHKKLGNTNLK